MPKKLKKSGEPKLHKKLKGFKIKVNEFGEVVENFGMKKLNSFLNTAMKKSDKYKEEE